MTVHRLVPIIVMLMLAPLAAQAQAIPISLNEPVTVCQAASLVEQPDFASPECEATSIWSIDPQGRTLWVRARFTLPGDAVSDQPLGLYAFGKMSASVWINGEKVGDNGMPGLDGASESAGSMDAVFPLPQRLLKAGENEAVLLVSAHHGLMEVRNPVHALFVADYADPQSLILQDYLSSLLTLGAFVLALFYFGVLFFSEGRRWQYLVLILLTASMAAQLLLEASRGLVAYPYPFHDIRLVLIVMLSFLSGLCLSVLVCLRFAKGRRAWGWVGAGAAISLFLIFTIRGFDGKALYALLANAGTSLVLTLLCLFRRETRAIPYAIALAVFAVLILFGDGRFLDNLFYYAIAGLILFLFVQQAIAMARERRARRREAETARKLELALDQARERTAPQMLSFKSPGKVERVAANSLVRCSGAGDYVELLLADGTTQLHSGTLNELEESLPAQFLRVHRSHLVNTGYVTSLTRAAAGTGELEMSVGEPVPVSRRILPSVREALSDQATT